jgi:hypothetical protein
MQSYIPNLPFLLVALLVVLLARSHPQGSIAPARKDSRASSLQWMPDVAQRRGLLLHYEGKDWQARNWTWSWWQERWLGLF